jgi:EAL domain-containing protein (putative c-di-GMP-specific phosphodiesterase class I)
LLRRHGLDPQLLVVEVTESALRDGGARLEQTVRQLGEHGVRWALDDFGAEWSSLSRLRELPVELLKVDRAFVRHVPRDPRACDLLGAILALAAALGARTVVEGIETPDQLEFVREAGGALGQGFLLGRPAPAGTAEALLRAEGERRSRGRRARG